MWLLGLVARNSAIMVNADYRLIPEATGAGIFDDLSALYLWVSSGLAPFLAKSSPGVEADLDHLLTVGPSAVGWCTLQAYLNLAMLMKSVLVAHSTPRHCTNMHTQTT